MTQIEKYFVPYQEAIEMKELGFDEPCFAFFQVEYAESKPTMVDDEHEYRTTGYRTCKNSEIPQHYTSAPTYSQAFRFFREKYNLHCWVGCKTLDNGETVYIGNGRTIPNTLSNGFIVDIIPYEPKPTPEEAELACLKKLIEIVKNKNT